MVLFFIYCYLVYIYGLYIINRKRNSNGVEEEGGRYRGVLDMILFFCEFLLKKVEIDNYNLK